MATRKRKTARKPATTRKTEAQLEELEQKARQEGYSEGHEHGEAMGRFAGHVKGWHQAKVHTFRTQAEFAIKEDKAFLVTSEVALHVLQELRKVPE